MAGQIGWKSETTWGTAVTPDVFMPVLSAGVAPLNEGYMETKGIRASRFTKSPKLLGKRTVGGNVKFELPNTSIAALLKHCFGGVSTSGSGTYTHTFTPATRLSKSLTLQMGIDDAGGTARAFTASGCKVDTFDLTCKVGELVVMSFDWSGKDIVTATALATASYATLAPFTFVHGSVSIGGTAVASANSVTFKGATGVKKDRHVIGSRLIREQLQQERMDFSSEIIADFDDLTLYALAVAGTQVASVYTLSNGTESLVITTSGQVVGDPPSLENIGLEPQTIKLDHSHATTDASGVTAVLINSEASAA